MTDDRRTRSVPVPIWPDGLQPFAMQENGHPIRAYTAHMPGGILDYAPLHIADTPPTPIADDQPKRGHIEDPATLN